MTTSTTHVTPSILPMREEHLPSVSILAHQLGYPVPIEKLSERYLKLSKKSNAHHLFVGMIESTVIAWMHAESVDGLIVEPQLQIRALVVDEKYRSKKIGKCMIDHAKSFAQSQGISTLSLWANTARDDAHRFYEREGFQKVGYFFTLKV